MKSAKKKEIKSIKFPRRHINYTNAFYAQILTIPEENSKAELLTAPS